MHMCPVLGLLSVLNKVIDGDVLPVPDPSTASQSIGLNLFTLKLFWKSYFFAVD